MAVRAARLTAAGIAGILRHLGCDDRAHQAKRNVVAVEGAVVRNYDMYRRVLRCLGKMMASWHIQATHVITASMQVVRHSTCACQSGCACPSHIDV